MRNRNRLRLAALLCAAVLAVPTPVLAAEIPEDPEAIELMEETGDGFGEGTDPAPEDPTPEDPTPEDPIPEGYVVTKTDAGLTVTYNGELLKSVHLAILVKNSTYTVVKPGTASSIVYTFDADGNGKKSTGTVVTKITYEDTEKSYYVKAGKIQTASKVTYILYKSYVYKVQKTGAAAKYTVSKSGSYKKTFSGKVYSVNYKTAKATLFTGKYNNKIYKKGKLTVGWQTIGKSKYYAIKKAPGVPVKGLKKISKKWYVFNTKGVLAKKDTTIKKVTYYLDKNGHVEAYKKSGTYYKPTGKAMTRVQREDYKTLRKAREIVKKITKTSMTKEEKLKICFDYVIKFPYKRPRTPFPKDDPTWPSLYANDHFYDGAGDCHSDAAAFAYLARAIGYTDVYVCLDAVLSNPNHHAWTKVNGLNYDPLFAEAKNYNKYYAASSYELTAIVKEKVGVGFIGDK